MKKEYLYLAIVGVVLYIVVQNKKDEEKEENRVITIGDGRRYWNEPPKWEDSKPAQLQKSPAELIDNSQKNMKIGGGLVI